MLQHFGVNYSKGLWHLKKANRCKKNMPGFFSGPNLEFGARHFKYVPKGSIFWELFLAHLDLEGKLFMLLVVAENSEKLTISDLSTITRCWMLFQQNIMKQPWFERSVLLYQSVPELFTQQLIRIHKRNESNLTFPRIVEVDVFHLKKDLLMIQNQLVGWISDPSAVCVAFSRFRTASSSSNE